MAKLLKQSLHRSWRLARHKLLQKTDETVFNLLLKPPAFIRKRSAPENLSHNERVQVLRDLCEAYAFADSEDKNRAFFCKGQPIAKVVSGKSPAKGWHSKDLTWPSFYEPYWKDHHLTRAMAGCGVDAMTTFREKFFRVQENHHAYARLYQLDPHKTKPVLICLHGYYGGYFQIEERAWPITEALNQGFDVAIMVLPYHSYRKEKNRRFKAPRFPSADPRFTIEALRQTYFDYQSLKASLMGMGHREVAVAGMSLGGYCTALISALDAEHSKFLPVIPMGCLTELPLRQNRLGQTPDESLIQADLIKNLFRLVNPLSYTPQFDGSKMKIFAAEADAITGIKHSEILARHFKSDLHVFPGSHMMRSGFNKLWREALAPTA